MQEPRFVIQPDPRGYSVRDLRTGETAIIPAAPQTGLSRQDAEHTAALLNRTAAEAVSPPGRPPP